MSEKEPISQRTRSPLTEQLWERAKQLPKPSYEEGLQMLKEAGKKYLQDRQRLGLDDPKRTRSPQTEQYWERIKSIPPLSNEQMSRAVEGAFQDYSEFLLENPETAIPNEFWTSEYTL